MNRAIFVPCYKRPEYTKKCLEALMDAQGYEGDSFFLVDDGSGDGTYDSLYASCLGNVITHAENHGLRSCLIDFFNDMKLSGFTLLAKVDNDCMVPKNWLNDLEAIMNKNKLDIVCPNVFPSNAALRYGKPGEGYRPTQTIGGVWVMKRALIDDVSFEKIDLGGLKGAVNIMQQIAAEKEPKMGWTEEVVFQDLGHWSGNHPDHIKSQEHEEYSAEVGRNIAWSA